MNSAPTPAAEPAAGPSTGASAGQPAGPAAGASARQPAGPSTDPPAGQSPGHAGATDQPPRRVRVVLADVARARGAQRAREELAEQSQIGEALVRGLVRTQLALALRLAAVVVVGLGGLPLLFAAAPAVAWERPFGIPLPWLLLSLFAYPFLAAVGWAYVYLAERTEREFAELVERPDQ